MARKFTIKSILISLMTVALMLTAMTPVSARGFSGGHSSGGHSTYHSPSRSTGGTTNTFRSYRSTTPRSSTPSRSYHYSSPSTTNKTYRVNRNQNSSRNYTQPHRQSIRSEFGHSIVRGAGWSIGSHMGDSIWHQTFGFGGNRYYDDSGRVQYARAGYSGWFGLLFMIIFVGVVIWLLRRFVLNRNRHIY